MNLKDNKWDLKERRKYEESHIDLSEIELTDDDNDEFNGEEEDLDTENDEDEY